MGPFSKKPSEPQVNQSDSTRVDPAHETLPSTSAQPVVQKAKHSKALSFVSVLFLLMLLVAGVMTYMWYDQKSQAESLTEDISASETVIENLKSRMNNDVGLTPEPVPSNVKSDDDMIQDAVVIYNHAFTASEKTEYEVAVSKKDGVFAIAKLSEKSSAAGATCILKKVDGSWLVIYCGQSAPLQVELDARGVPKTFMTGV